MLRLILASICLIATRVIAAVETNSTTNSTGNGIFGTPPPITLGVRAIGDSDNGLSCSSKGKVGTSCVTIFKCTSLFLLYQKPVRTLTSNEKSSLLDSFCGWTIGAPKVCCENGNKPLPIVRTRPTTTTTPLPIPEIRCGSSILTENRNKVTGGEPALLGAWPWMAALYARNSNSGTTNFRCGGSLIANQWVLTAAHCIPDPGVTKLSHVRLGDLDLEDKNNDGATPVDIEIIQVIKHEKYSKSPVFNDIALLRLSKPIVYSDYIRPICLHTAKTYLSDTYYDPKKPFIAGWGAVEYLGERPTQLLEAEINVVPSSTCASNYDRFIKANSIKIDKTVICANAPTKDTCQGDSGGPLMFRGDDQIWYQGGIVSVGFECANEEYPGVYTKVAAFTDWIRSRTGLKYL